MSKQSKNKFQESSQKKIIKDFAVWYKDSSRLLFILAVLAFTFVCYSPALDKSKEFTNWDDPEYVTEQKIITSLDFKNIEKMFNIENDVSLNYHPLTVLSLAINYRFSKLNPRGYFLINILFHLLNTFLIFIFLYLLSKKKFWLAALSSLFFGIHPMHVESVAWISERKDVLYCFFFLLSCISYLKFLEKKKYILLLLCFVFFILSCLSKAMAVVLPVVLILIDIYYKRKYSWKLLLEKIPFFVVSVLVGIIAIRIQSHGAIAKLQAVTLIQRFDFAAYGFMMYWAKLFIPFSLSAFYKYPNLTIYKTVPLIYQLSPFIVIGSLVAIFYWFYKKSKEKFYDVLFGIGFYTITVLLVLQFIMVGSAIMADRYSYLPYTGAFFLLFSMINPSIENEKTKKSFIVTLLSVAVVFGVLCYQRVKVWNNSDVLWTDVIEKYPYVINQNGNVLMVEKTGVPVAYKNRGKYYRDHGEMEKAFTDYDILIRTNTADAGDCSNMGNIYALKAKDASQKGDAQEAAMLYDKAIEIYNKGLVIQPDDFEIYLDRGITYNLMGKHQDAIDNFKLAAKVKPEEEYLNTNIAFEYLQLKNFEESIRYCSIHLAKNPDDALAYFYRGTSYFNIGKNTEAISDLVKSTNLGPENGNAWYNLSMAQNKTGLFNDALQSVINAQKNGFNVAPSYLEELRSKAK